LQEYLTNEILANCTIKRGSLGISFAPATLGVMQMKVAFKLFSKTPLVWNFENKPITSFLTILQQCWKKAMLKPSGPGAFSLPRLLMAFQTSFSKTPSEDHKHHHPK